MPNYITIRQARSTSSYNPNYYTIVGTNLIENSSGIAIASLI